MKFLEIDSPVRTDSNFSSLAQQEHCTNKTPLMTTGTRTGMLYVACALTRLEVPEPGPVKFGTLTYGKGQISSLAAGKHQ